MFIYSIRASTIKFFAVICLVLILFVSVVAISQDDAIYTSVTVGEINYGGIKSKEDRIAFIENFGLKINADSETKEEFKLPENFDRVIQGYNQIQISQGLNLTKYAKKRVTHYSYEVTNYNSDAKVVVNLLVYKNKIIATDISSLNDGGFVMPLTDIDQSNLKG